MSDSKRYTDHLDVLLALVTYLALTSKRSRTPGNLARDLALPPDAVASSFENFPGLFRKSQNVSGEGEHFYTLHARFALRGTEEDVPGPAMGTDLLRSLLDFISQRSQDEAAGTLADRTLRHANRNTVIAAVAAVIAALLSLSSVLFG